MKNISFLLTFILCAAITIPVFAQEDPLGEDDTAATAPADESNTAATTTPTATKKIAKKKTTKKSVGKKAATKKKKAKKKVIHVDEYKFKTDTYDSEPTTYKFNKDGEPIFPKTTTKTPAKTSGQRKFGKDYSKSYQGSSDKGKAQKPFDEHTSKSKRNEQSSELVLPDGIGQSNGLIAVDPIVETR